jgi:hypothetical protein
VDDSVISVDSPKDETGALSEALAEIQTALLRERELNATLGHLDRVIQSTVTDPSTPKD